MVHADNILLFVWTNEDVGRRLLVLRSFEKNELHIWKQIVRPGDACVDIGENVGLYSLHFSNLCRESGRVLVFEPIRRNAAIIRLSREFNKLSNIDVYELAVSNQDGPGQLCMISPDSGYAHLTLEENADSIPVTCVRLDSFFSRSDQKIDVLKLDIEGAEGLAIEGAEQILSDPTRKPRAIMMELVDRYLSRYKWSSSRLIDKMLGFGYIRTT